MARNDRIRRLPLSGEAAIWGRPRARRREAPSTREWGHSSSRTRLDEYVDDRLSRRPIRLAQERDHVGHARIAAELHQERRHLTAVVGLVVEEVLHGVVQW